MQVDVTDCAGWPRSLCALVDIGGVSQRVVLVDLLLNRATVTAMRSSIAAVTAYIRRLRDRLVASDQTCSLVAASTTAVLAPWLYQTPYGLAKRRQLARYANSGITGTAFLLPSLIDTRADADPGDGPVLTYREAAERLASAALSLPTAMHGRAFRLVIPGTPTRWGASENHPPCRVRHVATRLVSAQAGALLHRRDSPQAHREASHYRLALTPSWLRRHIDHHYTPPILVRRLSRSLNAPLETALGAAE